MELQERAARAAKVYVGERNGRCSICGFTAAHRDWCPSVVIPELLAALEVARGEVAIFAAAEQGHMAALSAAQARVGELEAAEGAYMENAGGLLLNANARASKAESQAKATEAQFLIMTELRDQLTAAESRADAAEAGLASSRATSVKLSSRAKEPDTCQECCELSWCECTCHEEEAKP